ncbi:Germin-like protein 9-3 [Thalictrum thalictroides]|uniref:Germin-like protein n=1 Tax=Thalictrum thalictroides TaxID=46969 RepID=A0A7J6WHH3_THATH|nr:Germin-like protein 9-3 [Thalictrum thalictroides]
MEYRFRNSFVVLVISFAVTLMAKAGDEDFVIPSNVTVVDGSFFASTSMRVLIGAEPPTVFSVMKTSLAEFPALNGHSVSYAVLQYPGGTVNPPHTHPSSSELLFLLTGSLVVGFIDSSNIIYTKSLEAGDMFVFPKGLIHYQYNNIENESAFAISAFCSANAGTVSVPGDVFTSGFSDFVLAKAFKTDIFTVQKIKAGLTQA